jgi:hypothetical protein
MHTSEDQKNKGGSCRSITDTEWQATWKDISLPHMNVLVMDYLYHEGYAEIAECFAKEVNLQANTTPLLQDRSSIRKCIEIGDIDGAISKINDLNTEILDNNIELYYFLLQHKAMELVSSTYEKKEGVENESALDDAILDDALKFIQDKLTGIVEAYPALLTHLEDLLEYLVFNNGECIYARRRRLASFVNKAILSNYGDSTNELREIVQGIVCGEKKLSKRFKFPSFSHFFK